MGIVNITPDSFSDGGKYFESDKAVEHAEKLIWEGADIIDLGAQSTRPGYEAISADEEWERLEPVLKKLRAKTDIPISVDTFYYSVAKRALDAGADIINDVSGNVNNKMIDLIKEYKAGWIITFSDEGGANEAKAFFESAAGLLRKRDADLSRICFDMGIGFNKNYEQNLELIARVKEYKYEACPLLLGVSRKRVIATAGGEFKSENRTYGNIAADTAAIFGGVNIIRVHNIIDEKQGIKVATELIR